VSASALNDYQPAPLVYRPIGRPTGTPSGLLARDVQSLQASALLVREWHRASYGGLRAAAAVMRLDKDDPTYGAAILLIGEHLARAGNWAVLRRLVSEWDPIGATTREPRSPPHCPTGDVSGG
jgi:hypothetical protein